MIRSALTWLAVLAALGVIYGALSGLHRSVDSVAMLRPGFALVTLVGVVTAHQRLIRRAFAAVALAGLISVVLPAWPQPPGKDLRVYSKNLKIQGYAVTALVADILAAQPDIVLLQELSPVNVSLLERLAQTYPHQHICRFEDSRDAAILSPVRFLGPGRCTGVRAMAAAQIAVDGAPAWVVSAHVPWPWPKQSHDNEAEAMQLLKGLDGPVFVVGDFNILPWSPRLHRIARASGTRRAGPMRHSFTYRGIPLAIDHALAPGGGRITQRPRFGSDHFGLLAELSL